MQINDRFHRPQDPVGSSTRSFYKIPQAPCFSSLIIHGPLNSLIVRCELSHCSGIVPRTRNVDTTSWSKCSSEFARCRYNQCVNFLRLLLVCNSMKLVVSLVCQHIFLQLIYTFRVLLLTYLHQRPNLYRPTHIYSSTNLSFKFMFYVFIFSAN